MSTYRIAAVQMTSSSNVTANLNEAARLISDAVNMDAKLIILPENFALMAMDSVDNVTIREKPGTGPIQDFLSQQAARYGIWLVGGTLPIETDDPHKVRAACLVFDNTGECVARYDKIHLFDVITAEGEHYCESETLEPGHQVVVINTPYGRLGLAVCYDLRFPELFRSMLAQGVDLISTPSAFTATTGKAHWEVLVRARAIENLCYVVAPNQGGYHVNGRETYGNSMIVDPWGVVLTRLNQEAGVIYAEVNREEQAKLRRNFPAIKHRKIQCQLP
ncbi:carbon-nitrogen hydrolase family protein [Candidatus Parabeggiatoa sp. HSG14]|uniref:carbon-nitrogen hydrolase family protein n=1 Tax=Candidatus Parabeggiatoa sp. HSG14 TaxID=3055593 RepID=UPI0025A6ADF0|nr:carbon-nitrogen hydrolase family protein [Thiotrichales bacterium HSG14]